MQQLAKKISIIIIPILMQLGIVNIVDTTPHDAAIDFLSGLEAGEQKVMEKYMDNQYVNLLTNAKGDDKVIARMNEALFKNFSYKIEEIAEKDDVAVAKVIVKSNDFSKVMGEYTTASYNYVMSNLYTDEIADKEALNAQCLEIYVQQIETAAASETIAETTVFIPMEDDGYYGWNILMSDELMKSILGNLEMPVTQ